MSPILRLIAAAYLTVAFASAAESIADCEKHVHYGQNRAGARLLFGTRDDRADPAVKAEGLWHTGEKIGSE